MRSDHADGESLMPYAPAWFCEAAAARIADGRLVCGPKTYACHGGVWNASDMAVSANQKQTESTFGFKWKKETTFDSPASLDRMRGWLVERYGPFEEVLSLLPPMPVILDAGCGAAMSALEYFNPFSKIRYIGCDVSEAVWVAAKRIYERTRDTANTVFFRDDITQLPFAPHSMDCIFSEGVLHHTDSTKGALASLAPLLKPGGLFLFYIYRKKGPVREFTDDYMRDKLQTMPPEKAWEALKPLTDIGIQLGASDLEIDLPDGFPLLEIPAGKISLQRFFYWHVAKAFYRPELSFEEMHHINFDWYAPKNAHRQTPEEVAAWCSELGLEIRHMRPEDAGITVVARKQ